MLVEPRDPTVDMRSKRKGELIGHETPYYGARGLVRIPAGNGGGTGHDPETLPSETEAGPESQAGATISVLHVASGTKSTPCECLGRESTGEPDAGKPHVRFDEGEGLYHSLLYSKKVSPPS